MSIAIGPGRKFDGDRIVFLNDRQITFAELAVAFRFLVQNEERRKDRDPSVAHWRRDPLEYLTACLHDVYRAPSLAEIPGVLRRYGLGEDR